MRIKSVTKEELEKRTKSDLYLASRKQFLEVLSSPAGELALRMPDSIEEISGAKVRKSDRTDLLFASRMLAALKKEGNEFARAFSHFSRWARKEENWSGKAGISTTRFMTIKFEDAVKTLSDFAEHLAALEDFEASANMIKVRDAFANATTMTDSAEAKMIQPFMTIKMQEIAYHFPPQAKDLRVAGR